MVVIGLTGQSGAGKTTVSRLLRERAYTVLDADLVARQVVEKGKQCLLDLVLQFGVEILDRDGNLNRRKLGSIVFSDEEKRFQLNRITFPYIQRAILEQIDALRKKGAPAVFLDAPTLLESGSDRFCDHVVSILAPYDLRLKRIIDRDGISQEEASNRLESQHDDEFYRERSGFVIQNDQNLAHLRVQLEEMLDRYCPAAQGEL